MRAWQRRARLAIGVAAIAFAIFVAFQFKRRTAAAPTPPAVRTEPGVVAETTGGRIGHFELSHENAEIRYDKQITYTDGSSKFVGVTIVTAEKNGDGSFTATSKQATISKDQTTVVLDGDVKVTSASTRARPEHATDTKADNTIRAPGPP